MANQERMAANRSEIAVRIFRAGTELHLRTVAVFAQERPAPVISFPRRWLFPATAVAAAAAACAAVGLGL